MAGSAIRPKIRHAHPNNLQRRAKAADGEQTRESDRCSPHRRGQGGPKLVRLVVNLTFDPAVKSTRAAASRPPFVSSPPSATRRGKILDYEA